MPGPLALSKDTPLRERRKQGGCSQGRGWVSPTWPRSFVFTLRRWLFSWFWSLGLQCPEGEEGKGEAWLTAKKKT